MYSSLSERHKCKMNTVSQLEFELDIPILFSTLITVGQPAVPFRAQYKERDTVSLLYEDYYSYLLCTQFFCRLKLFSFAVIQI